MTVLALHTALPGLGVATAHFAHLFRESHGGPDGSSCAQQKQGSQHTVEQNSMRQIRPEGGREWAELITRQESTRKSNS